MLIGSQRRTFSFASPTRRHEKGAAYVHVWLTICPAMRHSVVEAKMSDIVWRLGLSMIAAPLPPPPPRSRSTTLADSTYKTVEPTEYASGVSRRLPGSKATPNSKTKRIATTRPGKYHQRSAWACIMAPRLSSGMLIRDRRMKVADWLDEWTLQSI